MVSKKVTKTLKIFHFKCTNPSAPQSKASTAKVRTKILISAILLNMWSNLQIVIFSVNPRVQRFLRVHLCTAAILCLLRRPRVTPATCRTPCPVCPWSSRPPTCTPCQCTEIFHLWWVRQVKIVCWKNENHLQFTMKGLGKKCYLTTRP